MLTSKLGFKKSAEAFSSGLKEIIIKKEIDDENLNKIEEFLISSDVGIDAAAEIKEIISQNKIDLLNESETLENYHQIKDFTKNTVAKDSTIIPISAQNQINVDAVLEAIDVNIPTPVRDPNVSPRMLIIRSFDIISNTSDKNTV